MELTFKGEVWYWRGPAPFYFVTIPTAQGAKIKAVSAQVTYGWGVIPVTAKMGQSAWTTSLFPKDGSYVLPIKKVIREKESLEVGDIAKITLSIELREPDI